MLGGGIRDELAEIGRPMSKARRPSPSAQGFCPNGIVSDTARAGNQEFAAMKGGEGVLT